MEIVHRKKEWSNGVTRLKRASYNIFSTVGCIVYEKIGRYF